MVVPVPTPSGSRVWTSWQILRDPFAYWERARARYGDTFWLETFNGRIFCTGDPALVAEIFKADTNQVRPFRAEAFAPLLGRHSVLMLAGPAHREQRRVLSPPFARSRARAFGDVFLDVARAHLARWPDDGTIRSADELLAISLEIIVRAVFGILDQAEVDRWIRDVREMVAAIDPSFLFFPAMQRLPIGPWPRFLKRRDRLDASIYAEIRRRRTTGQRGDDVLSILLDAQHEDGSPMADDEIRDELVTLLFAGHETTQIAMAWLLYHLARSPQAMAAVRQELDSGDGSAEALVRAPYLDAAWCEALRMTPIVPDMLRTTTADLQVGPHLLPTGTNLAFVAAMVHTRPDLYPEPAVFRPERFVGHTFGPHEYLPFGGGVRRCLGAHFSSIEGRIVVGTILRTFDVTSLREEQTARRNATMGVRHGVPLRVRRR